MVLDGFGTSPLGEIGQKGPYQCFPLMKCQNNERVLISRWPMSIHPVKTWTTKIRELGEIGTWFWMVFGTSPLGEIGEIGTLSVFSVDEVPKP